MSIGFKPIDAARSSMVAALLSFVWMVAVPHAAQAQGANSADAQSTLPDSGKQDELPEVTVSGEKPARKVADLIPFLRRILGQYTVDGKVDLGGKGKPEDRWTAIGTGNCVGFGVAPGVQCELNVKWPQIPGPHGDVVTSGVYGMEPMMILYGLDPDELGISYMQVNNKGLAEGGTTGYMVDDTVTFKTPCVNTPAVCQRVTRVTARSDSDVVDFQVDTEVNYEVAARFNFKLRRVGNPQSELGTTRAAPTTTPPAAQK